MFSLSFSSCFSELLYFLLQFCGFLFPLSKSKLLLQSPVGFYQLELGGICSNRFGLKCDLLCPLGTHSCLAFPPSSSCTAPPSSPHPLPHLESVAKPKSRAQLTLPVTALNTPQYKHAHSCSPASSAESKEGKAFYLIICLNKLKPDKELGHYLTTHNLAHSPHCTFAVTDMQKKAKIVETSLNFISGFRFSDSSVWM